LQAYKCPPLLPCYLVELYVSQQLFTLLVDTLVAVGVLMFSGLVAAKAARRLRLGPRGVWLLQVVLASTLVLVHEYIKEGYFFDPRDLRVFPPRSHESFLVYMVVLATVLRVLGVPVPPPS